MCLQLSLLSLWCDLIVIQPLRADSFFNVTCDNTHILIPYQHTDLGLKGSLTIGRSDDFFSFFSVVLFHYSSHPGLGVSFLTHPYLVCTHSLPFAKTL